MNKDRVVVFPILGKWAPKCRASLANRQEAGLSVARGPSRIVRCLLRRICRQSVLLRPYSSSRPAVPVTHPASPAMTRAAWAARPTCFVGRGGQS